MLSLRHIIALNALPSVSSQAVRAVVQSGLTFDQILTGRAEMLAGFGMRHAALKAIAAGVDPYIQHAEEQTRRAAEFGATILSFWDQAYPDRLRQIYAAPVILYVHGTLLPQDATAVAIVGTRSVSVYGRLCAEKYATRFCQAGATVVSGLARGADSYAHTAALATPGGRTIAVIASGLDEISPALSAHLAGRIARSGAVVTEYAFGVKAIPAYFPQRNRIISGISAGTVVIESDEQGGAMITANFALDQNREVFAVPGPVNSPKSRGTNLLIRTDRARLTQQPDDVLHALGYTLPSPATAGAASAPEALTVFERKVYDALLPEPRHIDLLCETTGLNAGEVLVSLLTLEFKGLVRQMAGKMFLLVD